MRLTKSEFVKYVNLYEQMNKEENYIFNVLNINPEWKPSQWITAYYNLLTEMCELEINNDYGTDLDWYCYDTNFGKNKEIRIVTIDDKKIDIDCADALYDLIMMGE